MESWRAVVVSSVGRRAVRHVPNIRAQLLAVVSGLRPAFLWDFCPTSAEQAAALIASCLSSGLLPAADLATVLLEGDVYTCEVSVLRSRLTREDYVLVDASQARQSPQVACASVRAEFQRQTASLLEQLTSVSSCDTVHLVPEPSWSLPAAAGLLLGYPVIYWCDIRDGAGEHCLTGEPLKLFTVMVRGHGQKEMSLFSFSVPWKILDGSSGLDIGSDVRLNSEEAAVCPHGQTADQMANAPSNDDVEVAFLSGRTSPSLPCPNTSESSVAAFLQLWKADIPPCWNGEAAGTECLVVLEELVTPVSVTL